MLLYSGFDLRITILYILMSDIKSESTIGPKINPSGPKKSTPPRIEKSINTGDVSSPLPKKYDESRLSINNNINTPNNPHPIASKMFPVSMR